MYCTNGLKCTNKCTTERRCDTEVFTSVWIAKKDLENLQKDQARLDWLASTEQNIGNVMLPKKCVEQALEGGLRGMIDCAMSISSNV